MYRKDGSADHYKKLELDELSDNAPKMSPALRDWLRYQRKDKNTVIIKINLIFINKVYIGINYEN